jgi:hypothetical protein
MRRSPSVRSSAVQKLRAQQSKTVEESLKNSLANKIVESESISLVKQPTISVKKPEVEKPNPVRDKILNDLKVSYKRSRSTKNR